MFGLHFLGSISILAAWSFYSSRVRSSLKNGKFGALEIVSEMRENYGDKSKIPGIAERFRKASIEDIQDSFVQIAGDTFLPGEGSISVAGDTAVQYSAEKVAIYGRKEPTDFSLRELVADKTAQIEIEEDISKVMNWNKKMNECVPMKKKNKIEGSFSFCYRDYVNLEELAAMTWKRGGIEGFLFKPSRAELLTIDKDGKCVITSGTYMLFRIIPFKIRWEGELKGRSIHWNTTSMAMGWKRFGKVFDRPPTAERLRKDPWHISIADSACDILCFHREGTGKLVFAKPGCLCKGLKSK